MSLVIAAITPGIHSKALQRPIMMGLELEKIWVSESMLKYLFYTKRFPIIIGMYDELPINSYRHV